MPVRQESDEGALLDASTTADRFRCDYLILVATESEHRHLETAALELGLKFDEFAGRLGTYYNLGTYGTARLGAVRTEMGPLSHGGSASRAIEFRAETQATAIISLGMAFGVDPGRQKIGDVLVSTMLLPYDNKDVRTDPGSPTGWRYDYSRVKAFTAKPSLLTMLRRHADTDEWRGRVQFGALLSGASRIFDASYRDMLVKKCRRKGEPVIGGEMEGVGLLATSPREAPAWVVVKGICDFADSTRDSTIEDARPKACANSARFTLQALRVHNTRDT